MTVANDRAGSRPGAVDQNALAGILFMCLAVVAMFPVMNAMVKYLGAEGYPYGEVVWARYAGHLGFMVLAFMPRFGWRLLVTRRPATQGVRSFLLFACTALYFFALKYLDLTMAAAISFTSPILLTALSVPFLGERVGIRRWAAVTVGFAGALIIIRPGGEGYHWAMLLVVANTVAYTFYQIMTRKLSADDPPETTITYTAVVGVVIASFLLLEDVEWPRNGFHWLLFVSIGFLGGFGHYFVVKAFQYAEASVVAPFAYGQLIGATLFGYLVFDDFPDRWTWIGAAIVISSGLYIAYREKRTKPRLRA